MDRGGGNVNTEFGCRVIIGLASENLSEVDLGEAQISGGLC